jgi:hypothetical protein
MTTILASALADSRAVFAARYLLSTASSNSSGYHSILIKSDGITLTRLLVHPYPYMMKT